MQPAKVACKNVSPLHKICQRSVPFDSDGVLGINRSDRSKSECVVFSDSPRLAQKFWINSTYYRLHSTRSWWATRDGSQVLN